MVEQLEFLWRNLPNLLFGFPQNRPGGLLLTILLTASSLAVGMLVAVVVGSAQVSRWAPLRWLGLAYSRVFRGIPLILLLLVIHQFLSTGRLGFQTSSLGSAFVTLVLYGSAYQADIIAGGVRAVPKELIDDTRVLGAGPVRSYMSVSLPYGLRVMRPALLTQAITVFKDSSVVVVLGVADLTTTARIALGADVGNAPYWLATYLAVGFLYFAVALSLSRLVDRLGRNHVRGRTGGLGVPLAATAAS